MPELQRPSATINYEVWGSPSTLIAVLINGHTRPLNDFRLLGRKLVERGMRVIALDNRGAGLSTYQGDFSLNDMVADVQALLVAEDVSQAAVMGISMGGFVAQALALADQRREPSERKIRRLALVSTASTQAHIRQDGRPWSDNPDLVREKLNAYFTASFAERNAALVRSMAKQIAKAVAEGDYAVDAEAQKRAVQDFNALPQLPTLQLPTLVVHGRDDGIIPFAAGEELARTIPRAQLVSFDGAGHLLLAERPQELYKVIGDFFLELEA